MKTRSGKWLVLFLLIFLSSCTAGDSSGGAGAYPKAVKAVDETSAIQTLRTIATAQTQAKATRGSYGDFNTLVQAGFLDQRFASETPVLRGYRFKMSAGESDFSVSADPQIAEGQETTGGRHFYLDSTDNTIHVNQSRAASKTDPSL
jgi:hypothetical protein